jgi:hypothetical protein
MWALEECRRHAFGCLAALALLTACDSGDGGSDATATTPASGLSAPGTVSTTTVAAAPTGARTQQWIELQPGDCLADPPPSDPSVVTVSVVDCTVAHAAEAYLRADVEVNAAIAGVADQQCNTGFAQYTGFAVGGSPFTVTYLIDSNQDRTSANPLPSTVICLLQASNGGPLTGSARR